MEEVIGANLTIAVIAFFLFYFPYKKLCNGFWDYTKVMLSVLLFYYIFYLGIVMGFMLGTPSNHLWYPYSFGGMPAYGIGYIGVRWWNHIDMLMNGSIKMLYSNPLFTTMFCLSFFFLVRRWVYGKKIVWNYTLAILMEVTMIFTTEWR